jgi:riboflavin kinase/FMN adenylyltransferase
MQLVRLERLDPLGWPAPAVIVGNFDGVHRGHRALVDAARAAARVHAGWAVALTFDPHPARLLAPERAPTTLLPLPRRAALLGAAGLDALAVLPFTPEIASLAPVAFAEQVLHGSLGARVVVVGEGFRFGRGRTGDVPELRRLGQRLGFEVHTLAPVMQAGAPVSSTRVRAALEAGDMQEAAALLGRPPDLEGRVVAGDARGRTLGFATANLETEGGLLPRAGVYAGQCALPGETRAHRAAVINIGWRPTFAGRELRIEAHLLDFEGDLYGQNLRVELHARLRDERRFEGQAALVAQIQADVAAARACLEPIR